MNNIFHPEGSNLFAAEKNIIRLRAIEAIRVLYYAEEIKKYSLTVARSKYPTELANGTKNVYHKMWKLFVTDGVLTDAESIEIQELIDYRNNTAHDVDMLFTDLSKTSYAKYNDTKYLSNACSRLVKYRALINDRIIDVGGYIITISMRPLAFQTTDRFLLHESRRLRKLVSRQTVAFTDNIKSINASIKKLPNHIIQKLSCFDLKRNNGTLTPKALGLISELKNHGIQDYGIGHLLKIRVRSVRRHTKKMD
jgi:hypothetical protein